MQDGRIRRVLERVQQTTRIAAARLPISQALRCLFYKQPRRAQRAPLIAPYVLQDNIAEPRAGRTYRSHAPRGCDEVSHPAQAWLHARSFRQRQRRAMTTSG